MHVITLSDTHTHTHTHSGEGIGPLHRPVPDNKTITWDRRPCQSRIRTRNHSKRAAADPRFRKRGHWDWLTHIWKNVTLNFCNEWHVICWLVWSIVYRILEESNGSRLYNNNLHSGSRCTDCWRSKLSAYKTTQFTLVLLLWAYQSETASFL